LVILLFSISGIFKILGNVSNPRLIPSIKYLSPTNHPITAKAKLSLSTLSEVIKSSVASFGIIY
jgi:hypothetical protein